MELLERFAEATETPEYRRDSVDPSQYITVLEPRNHCAYNQTRECFLGLEVQSVDLPPAEIEDRISARPLKSGEGLWMNPFQGLPVADLSAPLDLIYLDRDCRVVETVESFPTSQASALGPKPHSVLALPAHSIYSSQTQAGDQLVLCVAEEMGTQLQRLNNSRNAIRHGSATIAGAALLRENPLWSGGPGVVELRKRYEGDSAEAQPTYEMDLTQADETPFRAPRSWFGRWWSPDPRKAPRMPATGLAAYFWNGSAPAPHGVRDISSTGLYVVTEERWYPGTLVLLVLQRNDQSDEVAERCIRVQSRAVRWGSDGVGLQFILPDCKPWGSEEEPEMDPACRKEFERFLQQLKLDASAAG